MSRDRRIDLIGAEAATMLALAAADLHRPLVYYPEWTMLDLLVHTGSVHRRTTRIVRERLVERPDRVYPPTEEEGLVPGWFEEGFTEMVDVLASTSPETPVWGFGRNSTVGFWIARMALETSVHRWDAQQPWAQPDPIDSALAESGIDEFGWLFRPARPDDCPYEGDLLALRLSDRDAAWVLLVDEDRFRLRRGEGVARAGVAGSASDLYLWLMGRIASDRLDLDGDGAVVAWWESVVRAGPHATR